MGWLRALEILFIILLLVKLSKLYYIPVDPKEPYITFKKIEGEDLMLNIYYKNRILFDSTINFSDFKDINLWLDSLKGFYVSDVIYKKKEAIIYLQKIDKNSMGAKNSLRLSIDEYKTYNKKYKIDKTNDKNPSYFNSFNLKIE